MDLLHTANSDHTAFAVRIVAVHIVTASTVPAAVRIVTASTVPVAARIVAASTVPAIVRIVAASTVPVTDCTVTAFAG